MASPRQTDTPGGSGRHHLPPALDRQQQIQIGRLRRRGTARRAKVAAKKSAGALETVLAALLTDRGTRALSATVGVATKNLSGAVVEAVQASMQAPHGGRRRRRRRHGSGEDSGSERSGSADDGDGDDRDDLADVVRVLASEDGQKVLSLVVSTSIRTAVQTGCRAAAGVNVFACMVDAIVGQERRDAVTEVATKTTAAFCREAVLAALQAQRETGGGPAAGEATAAEALDGPPGSNKNQEGSGTGDEPSLDGLHVDGSQPSWGAPPPAAREPSQHAAVGAGTQGIGRLRAGAMAGPLPPSPWVRQVAELLHEADVRLLAIEVARGATREAVTSFLTGLSGAVNVPALLPSLKFLPVLYMALAAVCVILAYLWGSARAAGVPV
eukprot:12169-Chlamydomonas_euryale.AAC.8